MVRIDQKIPRSWWRYIPLLLIVGIGTILSVVTFNLVGTWERQKAQAESRPASAQRIEALGDDLERCLGLVSVTGGLYSASVSVERLEFRAFASSVLEKHSCLKALAWVPRVNAAQRQSFERLVDSESIPDFQIRDTWPDGTTIPAPDHEEYFPARYIEPYRGNEAEVGINLGSDPRSKAALAQARDSGQLAVATGVVLGNGTAEQFGILAFQPIYHNRASTETTADRRKNLHGFVLGELSLRDIVESSFSDIASPQLSGDSQMLVRDRLAPPGERVLYPRSFEESSNEAANGRLIYSDLLDVPGRSWEAVIINPSPGQGLLPWAALLGGLAFTAILSLYVLAAARRASVIEHQVAQRTEELRRADHELEKEVAQRKEAEEALWASGAGFRSVVRSASNVIIIADEDGNIASWNEALKRLFGYTEEEVLGEPISMLIPERHRDAQWQVLDRVRSTGETNLVRQTVELEAVKKDGTEFPIELSLATWLSGDARFFSGILQDISERKQREQELGQFFSISNDLLCIATADCYLQRINPAFEKILGYTSDELLSHSFLDFVHPEDVDTTLAEIEKLNGGAPTIRFTNRYQCKDGSYRILSWNATTVPEERLIYATARDVTRRRQEREELSRLSRQNELILDSAGEGIYGQDSLGKATFVNPAAARMLGWDVDELIGQGLHDLIHHTRADGSSIPQSECPIHQVFRDGEAYNSEDEFFWRKNGTGFPVECLSVPMRDEEENILGVVVTFQDISQRLANARMKDEFISVVSHELRTPLTSIRGSLGLLSGGIMGELPEKAQEMVQIALHNSERLNRLINDILDMEKVESGRVPMQNKVCDAYGLLSQSVGLMKDTADGAGVTISVTAEAARIYVDPDRVSQIMTNLLSNAIKFSPPGSTVSVNAQHHGNELRFTVADQGRGIPPDQLDRIFERFHQVDATDSREKDGTGLGLAICRRIIEQCGGRIWAESELGHGSAFHFTLPLSQSWSDGVPGGPIGGDAPLVLALICGDEDSTSQATRDLLEDSGYRVMTVYSEERAREAAIAHQPDAILLDIISPNVDACQTAAAVQGHEDTKDIPVIVYGALPATDEGIPTGNAVNWASKSGNQPGASLLEALSGIVERTGYNRKVMIVEDDVDLGNILVSIFRSHQFDATHAQSGKEAIELYHSYRPDLLVLDLGLPDINGLQVMEALWGNKELRQVPIVVYTAGDLNDQQQAKLRTAGVQVFTKSRVTPEEFESRVLKLIRNISRSRIEGELCAPSE